MADLNVKFCGVTFKNPLILPSGIAQEIPKDHERAIEAGAGGITTKSLTLEPREGYPLPRVIKSPPIGYSIMNAVGLRGPGLEKGKKLIEDFIRKSPVPVIVSIFAAKIKDFETLTYAICGLNPPFLELNLSCPHVSNEFGKSLGMGSESSASVVAAVKKIAGKIPILTKLTPNIPNINEVAKACEEAGADGIVAINTVGPGMVIDIKTKKPVLGNKRGGVSGPAIKPIAIRCVYDIYEAVKIPIIGMGGVISWEDVVEMMMAGATLVGVGSATYLKGMKVYEEIKKDLSKYMEREGIKNLKEIVGKAH
ncbi:dihydroorotate dehydrogenase [Candidatus Gottesmanbacteria bacterium]|nr:dihydroorotate dehydrogenase [Candidatus Gottesmanbacteria bacterium]